MFDALIYLFAGMGFSFIGVRLLSTGVSRLSGPGIRSVIRKSTNQRRRTAVMGTIAGAIMQSNNAITFIIAGLITAKAITTSRGLMLIAWANIGASVLVFIAAVDMTTAVMLFMGMLGFSFVLNLDKKLNNAHLFSALLGLGLLLYGLLLLKAGAADAGQWPGVIKTVEIIATMPWLAFVLGMFLTPITQTAKTAAIIAVAVVSTGLLPIEQAALIVLGSNFSSSVNAIMLGQGLEGTSRQAAYFQALLKIVGTIPIVFLFSINHFPFVEANPGLFLLNLFFAEPGLQLALVYLLSQIAAILILAPFWSQLLGWLDRWAPVSEVESLAKPKYLSHGCCDETSTALHLARLEQLEQVQLLAAYTDRLRPDADPSQRKIPYPERRAANKSVMTEIDLVLRKVVADQPQQSILQAALVLQDAQTLLTALQDSLHQFFEELETINSSGQKLPLVSALVESTHLILSLMPSALNNDTFDLEALLRTTGDKSEVMEAIRQSLMQDTQSLPAQLHPAMFSASHQFERIIWLTRRITLLLQPLSSLNNDVGVQA